MPHKHILRFTKLCGITLPFLDSSNQNRMQARKQVYGGGGTDQWRGRTGMCEAVSFEGYSIAVTMILYRILLYAEKCSKG